MSDDSLLRVIVSEIPIGESTLTTASRSLLGVLNIAKSSSSVEAQETLAKNDMLRYNG